METRTPGTLETLEEARERFRNTQSEITFRLLKEAGLRNRVNISGVIVRLHDLDMGGESPEVHKVRCPLCPRFSPGTETVINMVRENYNIREGNKSPLIFRNFYIGQCRNCETAYYAEVLFR